MAFTDQGHELDLPRDKGLFRICFIHGLLSTLKEELLKLRQECFETDVNQALLVVKGIEKPQQRKKKQPVNMVMLVREHDEGQLQRGGKQWNKYQYRRGICLNHGKKGHFKLNCPDPSQPYSQRFDRQGAESTPPLNPLYPYSRPTGTQ
ncbi:hypothetical protein GDO81_011976 [Engystomops pustulosus]|uniref:Uncharacterized protein n=1 Tax=Engystomops pustulosus TaxID=76066 RepID=A0AAV7BIS2_ENGPU|nr:hypothetical protein GDO81_011976 [Engystomops pustulosus]